MKKNILKVAFVAAIALVSGINVFNAHKTETLSDVVLANVEALANDLEAGRDKLPCYNTITSQKGCQVRYCPICDYVTDSTDRWYSPQKECSKL